MTKAILVPFHKYQSYPGDFYDPMLSFFLRQLLAHRTEFDTLYLLDSTWKISPQTDASVHIITVPENFRYYDAYKWVLPQIKEDAVLFLDNDMVITKPGIISHIFSFLTESENQADVISIYDTIGEDHFPELHGQSKVCPYLLCAKRALLEHYSDSEWGPRMPIHETLGGLTRALVQDHRRFHEMEEDKTSIYFDGTGDADHGKNLGYYHIRAGSTPAYLLTEKHYGNKATYESYLTTQPKREYLRQLAWYWHMCETVGSPSFGEEILSDVQITKSEWKEYMQRFRQFHSL